MQAIRKNNVYVTYCFMKYGNRGCMNSTVTAKIHDHNETKQDEFSSMICKIDFVSFKVFRDILACVVELFDVICSVSMT